MNGESTTIGWTRALSAFGAVGPAIFWAVVIVLGLVRRDYNHLDHSISALGAVGAPFAVVQTVNFGLMGLSIIAFAVAIYRWFDGGRWARLGPLLVGVAGLSMLGAGLFPLNFNDVAATTNTVHFALAMVGQFAALIGIPLVSRRLDYVEGWSRPQNTTVAITVVLVALFVIHLAVAPSDLDGLSQKLLALAAFGWIAVASFKLYQLS